MEDITTMKCLLMNKGELDINRKDKVRKLHLFIMMMMMMMMMIMMVIIHSSDITDLIIHGSYDDDHNTMRMFSI